MSDWDWNGINWYFFSTFKVTLSLYKYNQWYSKVIDND